MTEFQENVIRVVRAIPSGETMSYAQVAYRAGRPGAARAVGNMMKANRNPDVPCHRVIKSDGTLGGYNGNLGKKRDLLVAEGALMDN